jgi:hypothetical protein
MNITKTQAADKLQEIESALQSLAFYIGQQANAQQETYITAEQARKLAAGAEYFMPESGYWVHCGNLENFPSTFEDGETIKYRAVKAQPEPVDPDDVRIELVVALNCLASDFEIATYSLQKGSEDRVKAEGAIAHAMKIHAKHNQNGRIFTNKSEPVDPHAALRAEYAKQVKEGTTGFYLWELQHYSAGKPYRPVSYPLFLEDSVYRCTDISCYVSKDGGTAMRMLAADAKALQAELGDAVEWLAGTTKALNGEDFTFNLRDTTYTYAPKALKQDGWKGTREDVIALLKELGFMHKDEEGAV